MKKILFILFLFAAFQSFGQNRFPSIDSAKNYTLRYYRNSTVETFTNLRGQNIAYGTLELIDSLAGNGAIDSIWFTGGTPDTLRYRKAGTTFTVGTISGGGGGSTSLNNVGTGFDLAQQGTANVKRLAGGFGIKLDSTTTSNTVRVSLDTTTQTLTDAATVTFDANLGVSAKVTLTATRTLAFSNFNNGMFLSLLVIQDGTGGWGLNLPAGTEVINGGAGAVTLTTAAASEDILTFWKIGNKIYCNYGKNYN